MKIERLIGILSVLLMQEKVTAPDLAAKFEVSRRTINRDIETLCMAGIPIVTDRGIYGGISIMSGYKIDKTLFTSKEMQAILSGLKSLDSVSGENRYKLLMNKLSVGTIENVKNDQIVFMNLSSWYHDSLAPKFALIQSAIEENNRISFTYFAPDHRTDREVEPYYLIFEWSSWYVFCYCPLRKDFRLFKLNRMEELHKLDETFLKRDDAYMHLKSDQQNKADRPHFHNVRATLLFQAQAEWRLIEEFGMGSYQKAEDDKLRMELEWSDEQSLFSWILGFRDMVEIEGPPEFKGRFMELLEKMNENYRKSI